MKLSFLVTGLVIFAILTSLSVTLYDGLIDEYSITDNRTRENPLLDNPDFGADQNIAEMLQSLRIIEGMDKITSSVVNLKQPTSTGFDVLGALASAGTGILQTVTGLLTFPFEIGTVILTFYHVPNIIINGLIIVLIILVSFLLLSAYLRFVV